MKFDDALARLREQWPWHPDIANRPSEVFKDHPRETAYRFFAPPPAVGANDAEVRSVDTDGLRRGDPLEEAKIDQIVERVGRRFRKKDSVWAEIANVETVQRMHVDLLHDKKKRGTGFYSSIREQVDNNRRDSVGEPHNTGFGSPDDKTIKALLDYLATEIPPGNQWMLDRVLKQFEVRRK